MIRGVVFDLDGTLLDTEKLYRRFWVEAARRMGYPMEDRHALMIRSMAADMAEPLLKREVCPAFDYHAVRALRRQIMEDYIDENGVEPKPGLLPMILDLQRMHMRVALATATPEVRARKYLRMVGVEDAFDAVACAEMVAHGKPAPDVYLLAAQKLNLPPACLAWRIAQRRTIRPCGGMTVAMSRSTMKRRACALVAPSLAGIAFVKNPVGYDDATLD
ncbi:MAG: HAD family hydrolase [Christensenellales bacterium]